MAHNFDNIRIDDQRPPDPAAATKPIDVDVAPEEPKDVDQYDFDEKGNVIRIRHPDGEITVSVNGGPLMSADSQRKERKGWYKNLAEDLPESVLTSVVEELLVGIRDDETSRRDWVETVANGVKLLGLKVEQPGGSSGADNSAPIDGMSKIRHPLLLEACLRFQANARGEFLPVDGPVKIRDDNNEPTTDEEILANYLQKDFNHYLTAVAKEYYPDTDKMFLKLGFQGIAFKKVYYCPLKERPVSETIESKDLIVNDEATTLQGAGRVTHRIFMKKSTFRRMQILGVYRDIKLGTPNQPQLNAIDRAEKETQGVTPTTTRPDDRDREIYECYCELDLQGFEHKWKGEASGLPVPYRVTIDVTSRQILSLVRDYRKSDKLPERRTTFVMYLFVPGFGFYGIGLLHILGNTTNGLTAAWREMLDNGMFANFPGFVYDKPTGRQLSLNFRVGPGQGVPFDTQGGDIRQKLMPMPYQTQHMAPLMQLTDNMAQAGMRLGGAAEQPVEEGKSQMPVGTILAMIEQAQKILNSVHKRVHSSQQLEFQCMMDIFRDYPESFINCEHVTDQQWDLDIFIRALDVCRFVPVADPNTASQTQRIIKAVALKEAQKSAPDKYDGDAVERLIVRTIGFNPQELLKPPGTAPQMSPEEQKVREEMRIKEKEADTKRMATQGKQQIDQQKLGLENAALQLSAQDQKEQSGLGAIKMRADLRMKEKELKSEADDRLMELRKQVIDIAQNVAVHPESAELVEPVVREAYEDLKQRESAQQLHFGDLSHLSQ